MSKYEAESLPYIIWRILEASIVLIWFTALWISSIAVIIILSCMTITNSQDGYSAGIGLLISIVVVLCTPFHVVDTFKIYQCQIGGEIYRYKEAKEEKRKKAIPPIKKIPPEIPSNPIKYMHYKRTN